MDYSDFVVPAASDLTGINNIGPPPDHDQLLREIESLRERVVLRAFPYILFVCELSSTPALCQELGRQREITFRKAGESTGQPIDIDRYDAYYEQLIIWDEETERLVGGYRFGCGDKIFGKYGIDGFYIHSLFNIDLAFEEYLPYCIELGRSFITEDYQRKNLPLYLLWKGILAFQLDHPQYKYLIGPVSVSRYYSDQSRHLIMEYAQRHLVHPHFAKWFHPRIPFNSYKNSGASSTNDLMDVPPDIENILEHIRPDHIEFPVLMKQYIKQNARFLGFNLDPHFNNTLDGLMILDVADVPKHTIDLLQRESSPPAL